MSYSENDLIHDIVNKLTICHGKVNRLISKPEKVSKEDMLEQLQKVFGEIEKAMELVEKRKSNLI